MADQQPAVFRGPDTPEAFLADRQRFWYWWTNFTMGSVALVVFILAALAIFLL